MPNHVTHRLKIIAPDRMQLDEFLAAIRPDTPVRQDCLHLDFNRLVPMPESVRRTESPALVNIGLIVIGREDLLPEDVLSGRSMLDVFLGHPSIRDKGIETAEQLRPLLEQHYPETAEAGRNAAIAHEETGHVNWQSWSMANWGTRRNACSQSLAIIGESEAEIRFDTTFSVPEPVFRAIAGRFPQIRLQGIAHDEEWQTATRILLTGGRTILRTFEPTLAFSREAHRYWPDPGEPADTGGLVPDV